MGNCCSVASISTCYFTTWTSSPQGDQHSLIIKPMLRRFTHQVAVVLSERERKSMWGVFFPVLNKHSCFHAEGHFSDEWSGRYPAISKNNKPATEAVLLTLKWLSDVKMPRYIHFRATSTSWEVNILCAPSHLPDRRWLPLFFSFKMTKTKSAVCLSCFQMYSIWVAGSSTKDRFIYSFFFLLGWFD